MFPQVIRKTSAFSFLFPRTKYYYLLELLKSMFYHEVTRQNLLLHEARNHKEWLCKAASSSNGWLAVAEIDILHLRCKKRCNIVSWIWRTFYISWRLYYNTLLVVLILVLNALCPISTQVFRKNMSMKAFCIHTDILLRENALHPDKQLN